MQFAAENGGLTTIVLTFFGTFAAIIVAGFTVYPFYRRSRDRRAAHEERLEAACDAVLGKEPDLGRGIRSFRPGLVHMLPLSPASAIDGVPTVMGTVSEAVETAKRAETAAYAARDEATRTARSQEQLGNEMLEHQDEDRERFQMIEARLGQRA